WSSAGSRVCRCRPGRESTLDARFTGIETIRQIDDRFDSLVNRLNDVIIKLENARTARHVNLMKITGSRHISPSTLTARMNERELLIASFSNAVRGLMSRFPL